MSADDVIRGGLQRLVDDDGTTDDVWSAVVSRRRRRRMRRAMVALTPIVLGAIAFGVLWTAGDDRSELATGVHGPADDDWVDFAPFEMTYRATSLQPTGTDTSTWHLSYQAATEWTHSVVEAGVREPAFHRAELRDGKFSAFNEDGSLLEVEVVDTPRAPLAILSKGRWGGTSQPRQAGIAQISETIQCGTPEAPIEDRPCQPDDPTAVVVTSVVYNDDGVPVSEEESLAGTDEVRWRFEVIGYERLADGEGAAEDSNEMSDWQPDALGAGSWDSARTSADGRELLIVLVGGRPFDAADSCSVDYRAVVEETTDAVRISIDSRSPPPPAGPLVCTAEGHTRMVWAELDAPLDGRTLIEDQFDRVRPVFDGARLYQPSWLPDGWDLGAEGTWFLGERGDGRSWSRGWFGPTPEPVDGACAGSGQGISLIQADVAIAEENPPYALEPTGTYDVNGALATHWTGGPYDLQALTWSIGGEGFVLSPDPACSDDAATSLDRLLRFARGLRSPGTA